MSSTALESPRPLLTALLGFRPWGIDFFCLGKKFLVFNLVTRNLKVKYRRSVLGVFWTLLHPMAMAVIYYFVFKVVLNVRIDHYPVFILSGVLPWNFFSQTAMEGLESIVANGHLISKVPVPTQVFPFVGSVTNLVTLALAFPVLLGAMLLSNIPLAWPLLLLPVYFGCLFLIAYSLALFLALGFVFFRDLKHIAGILMQIWFYSTPVVYDASMIPERYHWILYANPLGQVFHGMRKVILHAELPSAPEAATVAVWTVAAMGVALFAQRKIGRGIAENL